jgi:hypothetical protein
MSLQLEAASYVLIYYALKKAAMVANAIVHKQESLQ